MSENTRQLQLLKLMAPAPWTAMALVARVQLEQAAVAGRCW
jgi:hypothetical protein